MSTAQTKLDITGAEARDVSDALARMCVLYPRLTFRLCGTAVEITSNQAADLLGVEQAFSDQLTRSRFDRESAGLRSVLYARLLS